MKKKEENVEDNNVDANNAIVGSTVLGESVLGESDEDSEKVDVEDVNPDIEFPDKEMPKTNEQKLADLINENPGIPVIPLVDQKVVTDNLPGYYTGSLGDSWVDDYVIAKRDSILFKDQKINWKTAIFVEIEEESKE